MEYQYPAGNWNVAIYFQDDGGTATFSSASMCQYGQLIAYQRSTATVNFPTAAPDVDNAPGDRPIIVENTGNMPLWLFMTGYDLVGNINPGATLSAMHFNVGQNLTASVEMQNGVQKNLSTYLPPGESSNATIYMWLSMPYGQTVQDYVPSQQWELAGLST